MSRLRELLALGASAIGAPPVLQVAADGQWEKAQIVPISGEVAAAHAAVARAAAGARILAMEVLWPGAMFVGTAWLADRHAEAVPAATRVFEALGDGGRSDPAVAGLTALLGAAPEGEVESADLGAVNAWLSVGPEPLWRQGEIYDGAAVDGTLDKRPDLMVCTHPVAAEFSVVGPRRCWIAIVVSTHDGAAHHLNRQRLHEVLTTVTRQSR